MQSQPPRVLPPVETQVRVGPCAFTSRTIPVSPPSSSSRPSIGPRRQAAPGTTGEGHRVSFGASEAEFAAVAAEVEVLIAGPAALKHMLPALQPDRAPSLRLIFSTSAGVVRAGRRGGAAGNLRQ